MFNLKAKFDFYIGSKKEIAKNNLLIAYFSTIKLDDEKLDAQREIKIEGLKKENIDNQNFINWLWKS